MAVEVDGRWSIICCRRAVAVLIVGVAVVGREEGDGWVAQRNSEGFLYPLTSPASPDTAKSYDIRVVRPSNSGRDLGKGNMLAFPDSMIRRDGDNISLNITKFVPVNTEYVQRD